MFLVYYRKLRWLFKENLIKSAPGKKGGINKICFVTLKSAWRRFISLLIVKKHFFLIFCTCIGAWIIYGLQHREASVLLLQCFDNLLRLPFEYFCFQIKKIYVRALYHSTNVTIYSQIPKATFKKSQMSVWLHFNILWRRWLWNKWRFLSSFTKFGMFRHLWPRVFFNKWQLFWWLIT